jgi:uncharacterized membrane protein YcaP (DUF421 family)
MLEIADDADFEARTSRWRRIAWWLVAGVLAAGLAGTFGKGNLQTILRATILYSFLLLVFRLAGNRILGKITTFDFVLLLVISETTGQVLVAEEHSLAAAFLAILTLIGLDIGFTLLKLRWRRLDRWLEGSPLILVESGRPLRARMRREQIDDDDILASARERHGLERMDQIRYAVLERSGAISIVPEAPPSSGEGSGRPVSSTSRRSRRKPSTR